MERVSRQAWLVAMVIGLGAVTAEARPVSFVGSKMPMVSAQPWQVATSVGFTPARWASVGAGYQWMLRADGAAQFASADVNLLLKRWNLENWQANAFLLASAGALWKPDFSVEPAGSLALEVDAESRHLLVLVQGRYLRSLGGFEDPQVLGRVGFAPFTAEYDEINPWVIVQYQYMPRFADRHVITPMLRLMYRAVLVELGSSLRGDFLLNFTAEI